MKLEVTYKTSTTKDSLYAYGLVVEVRPHVPDVSNDESNDSEEAVSDPNVLVFRRSCRTMNPFGRTDKWFDDEFFNVATPVDMYDVPAKEPDIEHGMPYYRDCTANLWFRNPSDLNRAKSEIDSDIASLCRLYDNLSDPDTYLHEETVVHRGLDENKEFDESVPTTTSDTIKTEGTF